MTAQRRSAEPLETFHGTSDGAFGVTLVDGRIDRLDMPLRAMDPNTARELSTTLVQLLNDAFDKHTADLLEAVEPHHTSVDPDVETIDHFVSRALGDAKAVIAAAPSLRRDIEGALAQPDAPELTSRSSEGDVVVTLALGQLRRVEISEHLLATARPTEVAAAIISAIDAALDHDVPEQIHTIAVLAPEQVAQETTYLRQAIATLHKERS